MATGHSSKRTKIENECRVTSETSRYVIDEDLVPPQDLVIEILRRLPVKSLARFLLVSKLWSTIIRSQDFIRSFLFLSIQLQPLRLLLALKTFDKTGHHWTFYLSSSSTLSGTEEKLALSCLYSSKKENPSHCDVHYVNGLISLGYGLLQKIINPSTSKSITLPLVKSKKTIIKTFFGYDPIDGQYKVLCISEHVNEHQVFTLGGQSWRMIECRIPHSPKTNGLCINGVLYYGAFTGTDMLECCLMRFDVRTEKLDLLTRLNEGNVQSLRPEHFPSLINYQGKVAIAFETPSLYTFALWVMEQDAEKWSKICFSIYHWRGLFGNFPLRIGGTIHTGEIVFVPYHSRITEGVALCQVVYYDHKRNELRLRNVGLHLGNCIGSSYTNVMAPFFNYVESAMLL